MNYNKENSKQYSATDIQKYLKGEMTPAERHALEKAALDDPFLADAIEGMDAAIQSSGESAVMARLDELKKEMAGKKYRKGMVVQLKPSHGWKIAAAAAILVIGSVLVYNTYFKPSNTDLAVTDKKNFPNTQQEESQPSVSSTNQDSSNETAFSNLDSTSAELAAAGISRRKEPVSSPSTKNKESDSLSISALDPSDDKITGVLRDVEKSKPDAGDETIAKTDIDREKKESVQKSLSGKVSPSVSAKKTVDKDVSTETFLNNFSGKVVDPNNNPLPNASIQVYNNRNRFRTDKNGNFMIAAQDSVLDIEVAHAGYEQANFQLRNDVTSNQLMLKPSNKNLDEAVVAGVAKGVSTEKTKKLSQQMVGQAAEPIGGWVEYEKYLQTNKIINRENVSLTGEVVVSFLVNRQGESTDFKIERSLSEAHDNEAIRLIKTGPRWKLKKGKNTRTTVIVSF